MFVNFFISGLQSIKISNKNWPVSSLNQAGIGEGDSTPISNSTSAPVINGANSEGDSSLTNEAHNGITPDCDTSKVESSEFSEDTDISTEDGGGQNILAGSPTIKKPKLGLESLDEEQQLSINNNNNSRTTISNNKNSNLTPIKMQTEGIRVPGLNQELSREITKFDSSEFDVSKFDKYQLQQKLLFYYFSILV